MHIKSHLMSTTLIAGVAAIVAVASPAAAQDSSFDVSGSVAITSDYVFRGFTQTGEDLAVQGSLDVGIGGFYAGAWGSNLNFGDGDEAHLELDLYAGYAGETENGFGYDAGVIWYLYPGADNDLDYDFVELQGNVSYDFGPVSVSSGLNFSPNYFADSGDAVYLAAGVAVPLGDVASFDLHVGKQWIDDNAAFGSPDYLDWSIGLSTSVAGFDLSLAYIDTDLSAADLGGSNDIADGRLVATIGRSL